jgi:hypothetical protein
MCFRRDESEHPFAEVALAPEVRLFGRHGSPGPPANRRSTSEIRLLAVALVNTIGRL